jgi:hypothetical protein
MPKLELSPFIDGLCILARFVVIKGGALCEKIIKDSAATTGNERNTNIERLFKNG